jgi:hypothetical protein
MQGINQNDAQKKATCLGNKRVIIRIGHLFRALHNPVVTVICAEINLSYPPLDCIWDHHHPSSNNSVICGAL